MKLRKKLSLINKCLVVVFAIIFSAMYACAAENSISGLSVKQNGAGEYNILLKLNKAATVKKFFDGENLVLTIPSAVPSDSMEIAYDNASDLQNVTVQKKGEDNTIVVLQGNNIENAQLYTKDISTGLVKKIDESNGFLDNFLFVTNKKVLASSVMVMFFFLLIMFASKPSKAKKNEKNAKKEKVSVNQNKAMTLRRKSMQQSLNAPSISYRMNGSFSAANMSVPNDFAYENGEMEEEIRKVG